MQAGFCEPSARADTTPATPPDQWNPTGPQPDDLWSQIDQFHNRMDQLFAQTFNQAGRSAFSVPNMDLRDEKDHYEVVMDMPGADKETINVHLEGNVLSVSGQRDNADEAKKNDQVLRDERGEAQFERVLALPGPVKAGSVKTTYANGVLTIDLPKDQEKIAATPTPPTQTRPTAAPAPNPWPTIPPDPWMASNVDPFEQIEQFHNRMDQLFADTFAQSGLAAANGDDLGFAVPSLDLRDDKDHYTVRMDMPGADKGTLKVNIEGSQLSVSGRRETSADTRNDNKVIHNERSASQFERIITLPGAVQTDAVKADYTNGVLTITLPKADKATDTINVTVH
jgi:HSP20 family protein